MILGHPSANGCTTQRRLYKWTAKAKYFGNVKADVRSGAFEDVARVLPTVFPATKNGDDTNNVEQEPNIYPLNVYRES